MKRILSCILALIMLFSVSVILSSCKSDKDDGGVNTTTEDPNKFKGHLVSDLSAFSVIYPSSASAELKADAKKICDEIEQKFGVRPNMRTDYVNNAVADFAESEFEILVGRCENREESAEFCPKIRSKDYGYALVGKKIVIAGGNDEKLKLAITHFITEVIKTSKTEASEYFYTSEKDYIKNFEYDIDTLKLNGSDIFEYTVVYSENNKVMEKKCAYGLSTELEDVSGYKLNVKSDVQKTDKSSKEIRIGATDRDADILSTISVATDEYYIGKSADGAVVILGKSAEGILGGVKKLLSLVSTGERSIDIDLSEPLTGTNPVQPLTMMCINTWSFSEARAERMVNLILDNMPDTIGFQEDVLVWVEYLKTKLGEYYNFGAGIDGDCNGRGEHNSIFYRKDKFELKESGAFWLTDTPDQLSKHPDSICNRTLSYVLLENKSTGKKILHINTHLDHQSKDKGGANVRAFQIQKLIDLGDKYKDAAVVMSADFNFLSNEKAYGIVTSAGYEDVRLTSPSTDPSPTFHNGSIIDYFFANSRVYTLQYGVLDEANVSDHYPIFLKYVI